jgi:uncharacterized protein (TIGR00297 family)
LLGFFVSSTLLSRLGKTRKRAIGEIAKGGARDALQVAANGGIGTLCALGWGLSGESAWIVSFAGAYAAATADTWGTEIGMLARGLPRSILTGKPLATGLSGGVSLPGTAAEVAGALGIAALAFLVMGGNVTLGLAGVIAIAGIGGALVDSLLGATLQARRWCQACERECENDPHACGTPTLHRRGLAWCSNDGVNLVATLVGATLAGGLAVIIR